MLHYMPSRPTTPTIVIDVEKIYALIEAQDDLPVSRHGRGSGKRSAFAEKIGRSRGAIWNLKFVPWISVKFATQIAEGLGVPLSEITMAADEGQNTPAEPEMAVALAQKTAAPADATGEGPQRTRRTKNTRKDTQWSARPLTR